MASFKIYTQLLGRLIFHPTALLIAGYSRGSSILHVYEIDEAQLRAELPESAGLQYTNAKVVLVGDSGVGKSGLGLVLSQQRFVPTESTHGRLVWTFDRREYPLEDGRYMKHYCGTWRASQDTGSFISSISAKWQWRLSCSMPTAKLILLRAYLIGCARCIPPSALEEVPGR